MRHEHLGKLRLIMGAASIAVFVMTGLGRRNKGLRDAAIS
jgi:hypothetical protein